MQFQYGRDDFYKCKKKSISNVILYMYTEKNVD